jgi:hypothetical protein
LLFLLIVALVAAVAVAVGAPLLGGEDPDQRQEERGKLAALEASKESKYREIRDAELDFHAGKLSAADFKELDRQLRREAIAILQQIDELTGRRG